ncbi:uncharacterized protein [Spinacia oleracea]|uniref:Reverse transcriptase domain-containing protein n=1 Tax=Spinacia oleracea TaxID=3562 RepID=A0ABM3R9D4_SPIOL|nr:uncharacterized protein LOC130467662 [Spinacia oleracea]
MEEQLKNLEKRIEEQNEKLEDQNRKMDQKFDELLKVMQSFKDSSDSHSTGSHNDRNPHSRTLGMNPKLSFPKFDGSNPRIWVKKCCKYFDLCKIAEDQRVDLASLNMVEKAGGWVMNYLSVRKHMMVEWNDFVADLYARFRDNSALNVVETFNKLQQLSTIEEYIDEFENLRSIMLMNNHILPDSYMLESFIGGLKPAVKPFVKAFKPNTIAEAIDLARLQEENLEAFTHKTQKTPIYNPKPLQAVPLLPNHKPPLLPTPVTKPNTSLTLTKYPQQRTRNFRYIPADVRQEKIAKGLCYYCDSPYDRNYKCQFREPQLFTVEIPGDQIEELSDSEDQELIEKEMSEPQISVSALAGSQGFSTMRVRGLVKGKSLQILVDSGSTHNFVDLEFAKKLGCKLDKIPAQVITVADGNHLACQHSCHGFTWTMQGVTFVTDVLLIPLGSCDMVLGIQWLSLLGPISWDFNKLRMEFCLDGKQIMLKGLPTKKLKVVEGEPSAKLFSTAAQLCLMQVVDQTCLVTEIQQEKQEYEELNELKLTYSMVFEEPNDLPPVRGVFDHSIPLTPGTTPVNIRPYRYPLKQRDVIEQLVQEMLDRGIIQPSSSPFASPVVLVGKKDGTWRLCVDYRELNSKTIKNKFPIPIIDELIDELSGATVFNKLDLRAGYHQMRVKEDDVYKTAFKTHTGHYEFLVMPFGLTNAPASFQNWMNQVFKPLLRKCVLVFFDDILVYSKSLEDHWMHLTMVFDIMKANQMYAKLSKCIFATKKVEYLGHFISENGVHTDPQKIAAVNSWPVPSTVKELRGFLGLAGYYRKFVKGYAVISKPLTEQLKKNSFLWNDQAQNAFETLKLALVTAPVLAVPNFDKQFIVETDASKTGIGAVLMQEGHPLAFISRALGPKWQKLSVYEKELLAIVFAVQKWSSISWEIISLLRQIKRA